MTKDKDHNEFSEDEFGEFQKAADSESKMDNTTIEALFPQVAERYAECQRILDDRYKELYIENLKGFNFKDEELLKVEYPKITENDNTKEVEGKLRNFVKNALLNAIDMGETILKRSERKWEKEVLTEVSQKQRDVKLDESVQKAINDTRDKIIALEEAARRVPEMKESLKQQKAILEKLQSMTPQFQLDNTSAVFFDEIRKPARDFKVRVESSVNKVVSEHGYIKEAGVKKVQKNPIVNTIGWISSVSGWTTWVNPEPVTNKIAKITSYATWALYAGLSSIGLKGSEQKLAEEAKSGSLQSLLTHGQTTLDGTARKLSPKFDPSLKELTVMGSTTVSDILVKVAEKFEQGGQTKENKTVFTALKVIAKKIKQEGPAALNEAFFYEITRNLGESKALPGILKTMAADLESSQAESTLNKSVPGVLKAIAENLEKAAQRKERGTHHDPDYFSEENAKKRKDFKEEAQILTKGTEFKQEKNSEEKTGKKFRVEISSPTPATHASKVPLISSPSSNPRRSHVSKVSTTTTQGSPQSRL